MFESEDLGKHYEPAEIDQIRRWMELSRTFRDSDEKWKATYEFFRSLWPDELQFLSKTCYIVDKAGDFVLLKPNYAQQRFYKDVIQKCRQDDRPIRGIICKARQLGFSTFLQAWQYIQCIQRPNSYAMTVNYDEPSTEELFQKTIRIQEAHPCAPPLKRDRKDALEFKHNRSVFYTRTAGNTRAGRSQTLHHLHLSEPPMWDDAEETLLSVRQSVPKQRVGTSIILESTAKGAVGAFYEEWTRAEKGGSGYVPFFAPWFWDPRYQATFADSDQKRRFTRSVRESREERSYMERFGLSYEQMFWRFQAIRDECGGSRRKFQQEYPASAMEAFLTTGSPVFDPERIFALQDNVKPVFFVGEILLERSA